MIIRVNLFFFSYSSQSVTVDLRIGVICTIRQSMLLEQVGKRLRLEKLEPIQPPERVCRCRRSTRMKSWLSGGKSSTRKIKNTTNILKMKVRTFKFLGCNWQWKKSHIISRLYHSVHVYISSSLPIYINQLCNWVECYFLPEWPPCGLLPWQQGPSFSCPSPPPSLPGDSRPVLDNDPWDLWSGAQVLPHDPRELSGADPLSAGKRTPALQYSPWNHFVFSLIQQLK